MKCSDAEAFDMFFTLWCEHELEIVAALNGGFSGSNMDGL